MNKFTDKNKELFINGDRVLLVIKNMFGREISIVLNKILVDSNGVVQSYNSTNSGPSLATGNAWEHNLPRSGQGNDLRQNDTTSFVSKHYQCNLCEPDELTQIGQLIKIFDIDFNDNIYVIDQDKFEKYFTQIFIGGNTIPYISHAQNTFEDNYFRKYIKYKTKYFDLKNQNNI
jgi:hypothetical protein